MHMSDALLSPAVGATFWAVSASLIGRAAKKTAAGHDGSKTVLMGVLGAFVFAAQMVNFTIPGTGSSGHIGGGLLLAVLLGPWRAFMTLASVLVIQALFFADGGLLALGCNIFNLAFFPAFVGLPLIYRPVAGNGSSAARMAAGSVAAATAGLLAGAFSVVVQTAASGVSELPFGSFLLFMLPIHAAIGIVEGFLTWGVLSFVMKTEPGLFASGHACPTVRSRFAAAALLAAISTGGSLSWYASSNPDGLEWSIGKVAGNEEPVSRTGAVHRLLAGLQERTSVLPGYGFRKHDGNAAAGAGHLSAVDAGTSVSGIAGSLLVLLVAGSAGLLLRRRSVPSDRS